MLPNLGYTGLNANRHPTVCILQATSRQLSHGAILAKNADTSVWSAKYDYTTHITATVKLLGKKGTVVSN